MADITPNTLIGEVLLEYPEAQEIMLKYFGEEVACVMCPGQAFDTFAMIADLHGIEQEIVDEMLVEMNLVVNDIKAGQEEPSTHAISQEQRDQEAGEGAGSEKVAKPTTAFDNIPTFDQL